MLFVFNSNGVCLLCKEWNRPLHTLNLQQDHKLVFGLLFSLESLTAKMDPDNTDKGNIGVPQLRGQGCSFHSFRMNTYKLCFMEIPFVIKIAAHILQETAIGRHCASDKLSGARRLRDAIILGYQLQRVSGRDIAIPEWYSRAETQLGQSAGSYQQLKQTRSTHRWSRNIQGLSDTWTFLKSLAKLDAIHDSDKNMEKKTMREQKAAGGVFNWEEKIFVAKAPGRLDVMGGIADYS